MSLILDALRKSERTRQQTLTGQLGAGEMPSGVSRMPVPWLPILGAILVVNGLLLFFFWPKPEPAVPVTAAIAAAPIPAPAYHPDVRPLAEEADAGGPPVPAPSPASRFTPPGNPSIAAPVAAPAVRAYGNQPAVQSLDSLPADLRQALPPLHLDVLAYSKDPAERFAVINLQRYQPGDLLPGGLKLLDIQPHGAVLDFHGTAFLLPAN
jgi:general secretion pathway protein B